MAYLDKNTVFVYAHVRAQFYICAVFLSLYAIMSADNKAEECFAPSTGSHTPNGVRSCNTIRTPCGKEESLLCRDVTNTSLSRDESRQQQPFGMPEACAEGVRAGESRQESVGNTPRGLSVLFDQEVNLRLFGGAKEGQEEAEREPGGRRVKRMRLEGRPSGINARRDCSVGGAGGVDMPSGQRSVTLQGNLHRYNQGGTAAAGRYLNREQYTSAGEELGPLSLFRMCIAAPPLPAHRTMNTGEWGKAKEEEETSNSIEDSFEVLEEGEVKSVSPIPYPDSQESEADYQSIRSAFPPAPAGWMKTSAKPSLSPRHFISVSEYNEKQRPVTNCFSVDSTSGSLGSRIGDTPPERRVDATTSAVLAAPSACAFAKEWCFA